MWEEGKWKRKKNLAPNQYYLILTQILILDKEEKKKDGTKMENGGKGTNKQKHEKPVIRDLPGGPVVKNLLSNPGDAAAIPGNPVSRDS